MSKSLFILKQREDYSADPSYSNSYQIATGMWNSAQFVVDALDANGRTAEVAMVVDANGIDAVVTAYNPTHVFIEGLWVTPAKFAELLAIPRHASRTWVSRIHSEIPFLAGEGTATDWIAEYLRIGVVVAPNAPRAEQQLRWQATHLEPPASNPRLVYLPNCYPTDFEPQRQFDDKPTLDIACFGAFRPLKNHLQQAFVALRFAEQQGKTLRFHVNSRTDAAGSSPRWNVENLFAQTGSEIVVHDWEDRDTFLTSLRNVDVLMQASMSETFNIVAADAIFVGTPILVSSEISWAYPVFADPQNVDDCIRKLGVVWKSTFLMTKNRAGLKSYVGESIRRWLAYLPV